MSFSKEVLPIASRDPKFTSNRNAHVLSFTSSFWFQLISVLETPCIPTTYQAHAVKQSQNTNFKKTS